MRVASSILCQYLPALHQGIDPRIAKLLAVSTAAVLKGCPLQTTALGRATTPRGKSAKHAIKRIHRAGNSHRFAALLPSLQKKLATPFITGAKQLPLLVDWVELRGDCQALVAAVPVRGRVQCVAFRIYNKAKRPGMDVHNDFLDLLQHILPVGVTPILITDAAFQGPWMRAVQRRGWHFVARLRHQTQVNIDDKWLPNKSLHRRASPIAQAFPNVTLVRDTPSQRVAVATLVLARRPPRGRRKKGRQGQRLRGSGSAAYAKTAREPWLLASSLQLPADRIVQLYACRMKIEQLFRDQKSHALGAGLRQSLSTCRRQLTWLFWIGLLAHFLAVLIGRAARRLGHACQVSANTDPNHLSDFRLGAKIAACLLHLFPPRRSLQRELKLLRAEILSTVP